MSHWMNKAFPASGAEKKLLGYIPAPANCLPASRLPSGPALRGMVVVLWLVSGRGFWYRVESLRDDMMTGYIFSSGWWYYLPVSRRQVRRYY